MKKTPARGAKAKKPARPPVTHKPITEPELHGVCLSVSQAGEEFGHDRKTITKRIRELNLQPVAQRNGYPVYRLRDLLRMERTTEDGEIDPDKMNPFERQAHFKAESERLKVNQERGLLMRREDVERDWARVINVVAMELEIVVDEIERDIGAPPLVLEKIENKLDDIRERIHANVAALKTEDDDG